MAAESARRPAPQARGHGRTRRGFLGRMFDVVGLPLRRRRRTDPLDRRRHDDAISFGRSPGMRDMETLACRAGFRSLLNLNTEGEAGELLSPNVEASWAHAFAMQHERVSIDVGVMRSEWVDRFLSTLSQIAKPVYVHSLRGRRAAALMAVHMALEQGLSGSEALERARGLGLVGAPKGLEDFVVAEVDLRTRTGEAVRR